MISYVLESVEEYQDVLKNLVKIFYRDMQWHVYDDQSQLSEDPYIVICNVKDPTISGAVFGKKVPTFIKIGYQSGEVLVFVVEAYAWWDKKRHVGILSYYSCRYDLVKIASRAWRLVLDEKSVVLSSLDMAGDSIKQSFSAFNASAVGLSFRDKLTMLKYSVFR